MMRRYIVWKLFSFFFGETRLFPEESKSMMIVRDKDTEKTTLFRKKNERYF